MNTHEDIRITRFATDFGGMIIGAHGGELCLLDWAARKAGGRIISRLENWLGGRCVTADDPVHETVRQQIAEYLAGHRQTFDIPLKLAGSAFQRRVWRALMKIPYGQTISYAHLARATGNPKAARAVAGANAANAISIIIPCHRVIASDGSPGGYAGGAGVKKRLLELEGAI